MTVSLFTVLPESYCRSLLGALTLEALGLALDPIKRELEPVQLLP